MSYEQVIENVYLIEIRKPPAKYFFKAIDLAPNLSKVLWTPRLNSAHIFTSEQAVEEFKYEFITPRKVAIIRMPLYVLAR